MFFIELLENLCSHVKSLKMSETGDDEDYKVIMDIFSFTIIFLKIRQHAMQILDCFRKILIRVENAIPLDI